VETESEYVVVGRAGEPDEAVDIAARSEADIILAGFEPISDSLAVVQQMHHIPVLVLSWSSRGSDIFDAVGCGAAGFLSKVNLGSEDLLSAMGDVAAHRSVFPGGWERSVLSHLTGNSSPTRRRSDVPLTPREVEILLLVVQAHTNKEIGILLGVAQQTVKNHLRSILAKVGVDSRLQLRAWALEGAPAVSGLTLESLPETQSR
jgi:DNA-binding NarL/FixJ family response regulator